MKPSRLSNYSKPCPVVSLDELPFQEGRPLMLLEEEKNTLLTRSYSPEQEVFMVGNVEDQHTDEEGVVDTELDDPCTNEYFSGTPDQCIYTVSEDSGFSNNELLENVPDDVDTTKTEDDDGAQKERRKLKNPKRVERRERVVKQ